MGVEDKASGQVASVFTYATVPRFDQLPLSLSSVVLGATPQTSSLPATIGAGDLPIVPTPQRDFTRADRAVGFVRVYQGTSRTSALVPVEVRGRVLNAKGQAVVDHTFVLQPDQFAEGRAGDCVITLPLSTSPDRRLPAGHRRVNYG